MSNHSRAFTLIELLVVIAIIGLLSSIAFASLSSARDKAKVAAGLRFDSSVRSVLADTLVASWSFDSVSGTTVYDGAGNNHGIISGTVPLVPGVVGNAASFNGNSGNHIRVPNSTDLQITGNQTISFWLYPTDMSTRRNPLSKAYGGEVAITQETSSGAGQLSYYYGTSGAHAAPWSAATNLDNPLELNKWNHVLFVRNMNTLTLQLYINGVKTDEAALASGVTASSLDLYIGHGYAGTYHGYIDEVKIYNEAAPL